MERLDYRDPTIRTYITEGYFGLEKESLRIDPRGYLSHTKHPFADDPHMDRDFCENQTELITKVCGSTDEVWEEIARLHKKAVKTLLHLETGAELLWPFSNPPYVKGEDDIPIASYSMELKSKERYRQYLAKKYGKKKMLFSGIHFNFSFSEEMLRAGYEKSTGGSYKDYKDAIYLDLAKKAAKYSWLIVYLTAASPLMDGSFFKDDALGQNVLRNYASTRCSDIGYWNDFVPVLEYDTLDHYVDSIQNYIDEGRLSSASELYYPVRLKPAGENSLANLKASGVNHIELRTLDLNPLSHIGIMKEDIQFLHLFLVYLTSIDDRDFDYLEQIMAVQNEKKAAKYEDGNIYIETDWNTTVHIRDAALHVLFGMEQFFSNIGKPELLKPVYYQEEKVICPKERYAVRVKKQFQNGYVKKGLMLAKQYADEIDKE